MNSSVKLKILLDSTYLLPIVGIEVEGVTEIFTVLKELKRRKLSEFYYTPFNIFEIIGKIAKLKYDHDIVVTGLSLIEEEFKLTYPKVEGYIKALDLRRRGFNDLIDLLLYATSLTRNLLFLTRDLNLISFLEKLGEETKNIVYEEDFLKKHSHS